MKLYYDRRSDGVGNFGDYLNPWLWQRMLPDLLARQDSAVLVGIGTLLNGALPARVRTARQVFIFGTGSGYERPLKQIPSHWRIYCLRGPLSCRALGLASDLAITDAAILVRRLLTPATARPHGVAFMPHVDHAVFAAPAWRDICSSAGIHYIDPRSTVDQVLNSIQQSQLLIAEAMHGAIAADALRIPWIPIITSPRILTFKWQDWCSSLGLKYQPYYILPPRKFYPPSARGIRSSIRYGHYCLNWLSQSSLNSLPQLLRTKQDWAATQLEHIAYNVTPNLSSDSRIEQLTVALEEKLDQLKTDLGYVM